MTKSLVESLTLSQDCGDFAAKKRIEYKDTLAAQQVFFELEKAMNLVSKKDCSCAEEIENEEKAVELFEKAKSYDLAITHRSCFFSSDLNNLPQLDKLVSAFRYGYSLGFSESELAREKLRCTISILDSSDYDRISDMKQKVNQISEYLNVYSKLMKISSVDAAVILQPVSLTS